MKFVAVPSVAAVGILLHFAVIGGRAFACEPAVGPGPEVDHPIKVGDQCEYSLASEYDRDMYATGQPVVDIGSGKIGQRHEAGHACSAGESLMFVDCNTAEMITIGGIYLVNDGAAPTVQSVTALQTAGGGPIALRPETTVAELVKIADNNGFEYRTDAEMYSNVEKRNRVDPFCGCKLYYPSSLGAGR